jgi:predicted nucleotidyltransferase
MRQTDKRIADLLKKHISSTYKDDIDRVLFIGSRATGTPTRNSDFDIVIILNKQTYDWRYKSNIIDTIYDFELEHNILVDVHIISNFELEHTLRGTQPFFKSAVKHGIAL